MDYRIFNMCTDVNAFGCTQGVYRHHNRVCTESWLWEKNPLPHEAVKPGSAECRSNFLLTELHPHPMYGILQFRHKPGILDCSRSQNVTRHIIQRVESFGSNSRITWRKELGKCILQWTTNDEKNTHERFRHLVSSSGKRRNTDNNKKKKEAEKRTDEKKATKLFMSQFLCGLVFWCA